MTALGSPNPPQNNLGHYIGPYSAEIKDLFLHFEVLHVVTGQPKIGRPLRDYVQSLRDYMHGLREYVICLILAAERGR